MCIKSLHTIDGMVGFNLLILCLNEIEIFIFIDQNEENHEDIHVHLLVSHHKIAGEEIFKYIYIYLYI